MMYVSGLGLVDDVRYSLSLALARDTLNVCVYLRPRSIAVYKALMKDGVN